MSTFLTTTLYFRGSTHAHLPCTPRRSCLVCRSTSEPHPCSSRWPCTARTCWCLCRTPVCRETVKKECGGQQVGMKATVYMTWHWYEALVNVITRGHWTQNIFGVCTLYSPPMQLHHLLFYDHSLACFLQWLLEVHSAQYPFMQPSRSAGQSSSSSHPAGTPEKRIIFVVLTKTAFFTELMVPSEPPPSIGTAVSSSSRAFHAKPFF